MRSHRAFTALRAASLRACGLTPAQRFLPILTAAGSLVDFAMLSKIMVPAVVESQRILLDADTSAGLYLRLYGSHDKKRNYPGVVPSSAPISRAQNRAKPTAR